MRAVPTPPFLRRLVKGLPVTAKMMPVAKRKFGCLMGMLPPLFTKTITDWCLENIPDFHLGPGGREFRSHVTVKFGFVDSSPQTIKAVKEFLQGRPPLQVRLGGFSLFTTGYGKWKNEDGDVLFIEVDSPDLHRLNAELSAAFPCKDTHPEYKPHVTVAYLDPSVAESYRGLKAPFLNCSLILDTLEWSGADGVTEQFSLSILPQFGSKALEERKDKRGRRYCIDTDTGKHTRCPPKAEEGKEKESAEKKPEGKRPARKPVEVSRHKRILKAIGKVSPVISDGLKYSGDLKEEARQNYAENVARVLHRMPPAARKMVNTYLAAADFYPTTAHLGLYVFGQYGRDNPSKANEAREAISKVIRGEMELAGAVLISGGALRLALDGAGHQDVSGGRYSMGKKTEQGIYSHEFGHVLDGPTRDISGSEQWKEAFEEEIARKDNDPLSKERSWRQWIGETFTGDTSGRKIAKLTEYAETSKEEALAEFSRLLYGSTVALEDIERDFPKASKVFKDLSLWPDRSGKSDAVFGDIFDERIPLDDQGSHADSLIVQKTKKTEKTMDTRSAKPSPPSLKSLPNYGSKGEGTCKPGQTHANTGCTPASGGGGKKPSGSSDEGKAPSQPQSRKQKLREKLRKAKERAVAIKDRIKEGGAEAIHTANKAIVITKNFFRDLSERVLGKTATKTAEVVIEKVQDTVNQILLGEDYDIPDDPAGLGLDIALNLVPDTVAYLYRVAKIALGGKDPRDIKYPEKSLPEGVDLSEIADMIVGLQEEYIKAGMDVVPMDRDGVLELLEQNLAEPGAVGQKSLIYWDRNGGSYFGIKSNENNHFANCERDDQGHCLPSGEAGQKKPAERPKQTRRDKRQAGKQKRQKARRRTKEQRRAIKDMVRGLDKATQVIKGKLKNGKMTVQAARAGAAAFVDSVAEKIGLDEGDRKRIKDKIAGYTKETSEDFGKKGEGELPTSGKHGPTLKVLKAVVPELVAQVYRRVKKARTGKDPRDEPANSQTMLRRILGPKLHEAMMTPLGGRTEKETPTKEQTAKLRAALEKEWAKIQKEGKGEKYLPMFQKALSWLDSTNGGALVPPAQMGKKIPLGRPRKGKKLTPPSLKTFGWHKDNPDEKDSLNELKAFPLPTRPEEEDAHQIGQALEMALERYNKLRHSIGDNDVMGVRNAVNNPKWMLLEAAKDDVERLERHYAQARGKSVEQKALEIGRMLGGGHTFRRVDGFVKGGFTGERRDTLGRRICYQDGKRKPCPKKEGEIPKNPKPADENSGRVNEPDTTTPAEKESVRPEFVPSRNPAEVQSDIADTEQELETLRKVNLEGQSIGVRHGIEKARKKAERDLEELRREAADAEPETPAATADGPMPADASTKGPPQSLDRAISVMERIGPVRLNKTQIDRISEYFNKVSDTESGAEWRFAGGRFKLWKENGKFRFSAQDYKNDDEQKFAKRVNDALNGEVSVDSLPENGEYWKEKPAETPKKPAAKKPAVKPPSVRKRTPKKPALKPKAKPAAAPMSEEAKQAIKEHFERSSFPVLLSGPSPDLLSMFPGAVETEYSDSDSLEDTVRKNKNGTVVVHPPKNPKAMGRMAFTIRNLLEEYPETKIIVQSDDDSASKLPMYNGDLSGRVRQVSTIPKNMMELNRDLQGRSRVVKAGPDKPKAKKPALKPKAGKSGSSEAKRSYDEIKADLRRLSIDEMRSQFASKIAGKSKAELKNVLDSLGYTTAGRTRQQMEDNLLDNLTSLKMSIDQSDQIRNRPL